MRTISPELELQALLNLFCDDVKIRSAPNVTALTKHMRFRYVLAQMLCFVESDVLQLLAFSDEPELQSDIREALLTAQSLHKDAFALTDDDVKWIAFLLSFEDVVETIAHYLSEADALWGTKYASKFLQASQEWIEN